MPNLLQAANLRDQIGAGQLERIEAALTLIAATQIGPEANTTANYNNRQLWCNRVLGSEDGAELMARRMLLGILQTAPVSTKVDSNQNPTDADIESTITALVDSYAGRV